MLKTCCVLALCFAIGLSVAQAQDCSGINPKASTPLAAFSLPTNDSCTQRIKNGFPAPDPSCTPGAINKTVTLAVLKHPGFKTGCLRDKATSAHAKAATYDWYDVQHPVNNTGSHQTCELDHLVSLELGGADTLDNIWPQCGPAGVALNDRFFKIKDKVENYLAAQVEAGAMKLSDAQKGLAADWTQYLAKAEAWHGGN